MTRTLRSFALVIAVVVTGACNSQSQSSAPEMRTAADSADQVMYNARMIIASNGVRRGEAHGNAIYSYDAATRFLISPLRVQFVTPLGRPLALVTASEGLYTLTQSRLETRGPVTMVSDTAARRLTTNAMRYDPTTNQIASDSAFTATAGTRTLSGIGFTADPGLFSIKCLQRCTGSLGR